MAADLRDVMKNGLYSIHVTLLDGRVGKGSGVILFRDGKILGRDELGHLFCNVKSLLQAHEAHQAWAAAVAAAEARASAAEAEAREAESKESRRKGGGRRCVRRGRSRRRRG